MMSVHLTISKTTIWLCIKLKMWSDVYDVTHDACPNSSSPETPREVFER